ncbi:YciI family protein [Mesorhizobium sp. ASY16-5R]|uniref:YciI family protein n=1 Tax=Mesorhizobium sp. ASY16-5R TaxID=3445772 RepID=UPI003F9FA06C
MKYICLVYGAEKDLRDLTPEGSAKLDASSIAYDRSLEASGHLVIAEALQSVKTAKSVRRRRGKTLVTDGPFAETKEQLLGFVMIEAVNLDQALDIAAGIPLAEMGTIEVRAIYDIPGA